jgi:pyridoxine 4-dehydrogenase
MTTLTVGDTTDRSGLGARAQARRRRPDPTSLPWQDWAVIGAAETVVVGGDLEVRRLGLGAMSLTGPGVWGPPARPDDARRVLRRAVELGVDLIDTADSYGPEVSETLIAEALHPYPEGLAIATKAGFLRQGPRRWARDCRPERLKAACEASLRRLRLERIDLFYLHAVDPAVPLEDSLGALSELRAEGKIRHIAVSNIDAEQLARARTVVPVAAVQNRLNLAEREADPVLAACEREGTPFVAWAPLAKGFLAGTRGRPAPIAARHGATPAQVSLAWILALSPVTVAIPGTGSVEHLEENLGAARLELTAEDVEALTGHRSLEYEARRLARRGRVAWGSAKRRLRRS